MLDTGSELKAVFVNGAVGRFSAGEAGCIVNRAAGSNGRSKQGQYSRSTLTTIIRYAGIAAERMSFHGMPRRYRWNKRNG